LTMANIAVLAGEMTATPYGWGGRGGRRDCSSLLRDLFTPFGIWLPRHSQDQALEGGAYVDLSHLSGEEKEQVILARAVPFATLLWLRGHIMLYVGRQEGAAVVFHAFPSVKIHGEGKKTGRHAVGRAAITTLRPGREWSRGGQTRQLRDAIRGMTFLVDG
ncbi:MAG: C40 family peptidase, partial [Syntrophales bacterium]|nr:C40 family peptidase [Syntrophales bacterium]